MRLTKKAESSVPRPSLQLLHLISIIRSGFFRFRFCFYTLFLELGNVLRRDVTGNIIAVKARAVKAFDLRIQSAYGFLHSFNRLIHERIGSDFNANLFGRTIVAGDQFRRCRPKQ